LLKPTLVSIFLAGSCLSAFRLINSQMLYELIAAVTIHIFSGCTYFSKSLAGRYIFAVSIRYNL
jgi:hypothetical protein